MSQILQIKELIDILGDIHEKFGNTLCYARSLLWGSVALWAETFEKEEGEPITGEWMAGAGFTFKPGTEGRLVYSVGRFRDRRSERRVR